MLVPCSSWPFLIDETNFANTFFFAVAKWRPEIELDDISYFIYAGVGGKNKGSDEIVVKFSTGHEIVFY